MSMVQLYDAKITNCILHFVGNKSLDIDYKLSSSEILLDENLNFVLTNYFFKPFVGKDDYCHFYHDSDLSMNEIFVYASRIFKHKEDFVLESQNIMRHLYESSTHPKVKIGELYIAYFTNCLLDGKYVDALGIFKSEHKDTFIKITQQDSSLGIESLQGININKLDKGCIIYNVKETFGYMVAVVDNSNSNDAKYWVHNFLNVKPIEDDSYKTQSMINMSKDFLNKLSIENPSEKVILLDKSMNAMSSDHISLSEFSSKVFDSESQRRMFYEYSLRYQEEHEVNLQDSFSPSQTIIRRKKGEIRRKTTIHLDNRFDICIHGGEGFMEQGYDEMRGQKYYKLFFDKEE